MASNRSVKALRSGAAALSSSVYRSIDTNTITGSLCFVITAAPRFMTSRVIAPIPVAKLVDENSDSPLIARAVLSA